MNNPLEGEPINPLIALRNCTLKSEKEKKKIFLLDMAVVSGKKLKKDRWKEPKFTFLLTCLQA